ncbi:MAG: carbohydrate kinase family protein, partial [Nanoarchaeota archaeon]|nr:carbohydrate kinase family protein [Nanoarchaeota archaeon]
LGKGEMTGYSIILDSIKHDRTILAYKGANNNLKWSEISKTKLKAKWFYFSTLLGTSFKTLEKLAVYAKKNNIKVAFNVSEYLAKQGPKVLGKILSCTEIFILNNTEAKLLTKKDNINDMLSKLHSYGPNIIAITCGPDELYVSDRNIVHKAQPHNVKVVETTGAGDAFAASFVTGMIKTGKIRAAIELGVHNAQSVIGHHGAKNKLLTWKEIQQICRKNKVRIS